MMIPQYQITRIIQSMRNKPGACPNLSLTGDTLFTDEGILIFEMRCLRPLS